MNQFSLPTGMCIITTYRHPMRCEMCDIWTSPQADMVRRPWIPILWVLKNKWRIRKGQPICFD